MTVREAVNVTTDAKKLFLCWEGDLIDFDPENELMMDAFGHYKVKKVWHGVEDNTCEIHIAALPAKEVIA